MEHENSFRNFSTMQLTCMDKALSRFKPTGKTPQSNMLRNAKEELLQELKSEFHRRSVKR